MKNKTRLLLIEDDAGDRALLVDTLRRIDGQPFSTIEAATVKDAVDALAEAKVDLILLDVNLPDSDGIQTFEKLNKAAPMIPIVLLTGMDDDNFALKAVQMGAQDYLVKGKVDAQLLTRVIRYSIERKRLEEAKDQFLAVLSHEIRTPISIIKMAVGNLVEGVLGDVPPPQRRVLEKMKASATHLSKMITNLLDLTRMESGKIRISASPTDLNTLIAESISAFEDQAEAGNIDLKFETGSLPSVMADPDLVCQVLQNLISNALRFAKSSVVVSVRNGGSTVTVTIADDGPGIPPGGQEDLFNYFVQVNRPKGGDAYKGTGLGLAICREILTQHSGKIWIESEEGRGARFKFTLPAVTGG